uniref:Ig-like domain-containing protein n=1 Tax=Taeniopygia guttata TaxID=59729 RepID=A0A674H122_TAEGU
EGGKRAGRNSMGLLYKPHFIKDLQSVQSAGDPATLQCKFSGTKPITAKWFKDGKELTLGPKYKISVTDTISVLKVLYADKKDSGEYIFEVQNDVGSSSCSASINCIVSGSHPISIQWYKDGQEITASEKHKYSFHDNTAFLEINKLEGTDSGSYTCEATNKAGSSQCSGFLTVKGLSSFFVFC